MASLRMKHGLSLFQKKNRHLWPDPEASIGKFCGTKNGKYKCWKADGPAQETFQQVSVEITKLLHQDCGPVPSSSFVNFEMFMIGEKPSSAVPHIMFACKKAEPRKEALTAVRKSEILNHYPPGIELGHWDYPPYMKDLQFLGSCTESLASAGNTRTSRCHLAPIFDRKEPWKLSAMQLRLSSSEHSSGFLCKATVGSIVEINEKRFYLAPAHVFSECSSTQLISADDEFEDGDSECEFGGFENTYGARSEEDEVEFMSQYSITPESSDTEPDSEEDTDDCSSELMHGESPVLEPRKHPIFDLDPRFTLGLSSLETDDTAEHVPNIRLEVEQPSITSMELDFSLIKVSENDYLTASLPRFSRDSICKVAPGDVTVTAMTGSGKALTGVLSGRPVYLRLPNTRIYQEVFTIDFEDFLQAGDCGSIIRDARTGAIYGHIFAGSVQSKVAYIIPAVRVMEAMMQKFDLLSQPDQDMNILLQRFIATPVEDTQTEHKALSNARKVDVEDATDDYFATANSHIDSGNDLYIHPDSDTCNRNYSTPLAVKRTLSYDDYTIAIICALPVELQATRQLLDEEHTSLPQLLDDPQPYILGKMGGHNIVIPDITSGAFNNKSTSVVISQMLSTFPYIRFGLMIGIGGSFATPKNDIRLGYAVIDTQGYPRNSMPLYDLGEVGEESMVYFSSESIQAALSRLRETHSKGNGQFCLSSSRRRQSYPGPSERSERSGCLCCSACAERAHWFPSLTIAGISEYVECSSWTNKDWQFHAAASAASYAKQLLMSLTIPEVLEMPVARVIK